MAYFVGIDSGGTFSNAMLLDDQGNMRVLATPATSQATSMGVNNALPLAAEPGPSPDSISRDVDDAGLGATVARNGRAGAKAGLITTRGFRDRILVRRGGGI